MARDFLFDQLSARAEAIGRELARAGAAPDQEAVHDLRVSIRRMLEALRSVGGLLRSRMVKKLRKQLKPVMKSAGKTRNIDIAIALCADSTRNAGPALEALRSARAKAARRLLRDLAELASETISVPTRRQKASGLDAADLAASILPAMAARYWKAGEKAARVESDWEELHRFRLATKHLRYTVELFAPVYAQRGVAARLNTLRAIQGHLGRINDCESARRFPAIRTLPPLDAWIEQKQRAEQGRFLEAWARKALGGSAAPRWIQYFAKPLARRGPVLVK